MTTPITEQELYNRLILNGVHDYTAAEAIAKELIQLHVTVAAQAQTINELKELTSQPEGPESE